MILTSASASASSLLSCTIRYYGRSFRKKLFGKSKHCTHVKRRTTTARGLKSRCANTRTLTVVVHVPEHCQLQLAPRQDVCVSCPSLSTAPHLLHASASLAELCVTAMLLHCQGAARRSSCLFQKEPPSACASALLSATGVLLDHLGGTAAPPATCGSAHARCDWGRGPLS